MLRLVDNIDNLQYMYDTKETSLIEKEASAAGQEWHLLVGAKASSIKLIHDETSWMNIKSHSACQNGYSQLVDL